MPHKSMAINLHHVFLNMQLPSDNSGNRAILSLDAAKAFDSLEWHNLWATLKATDFRPIFISWVQLLYSCPKARIKANCQLSDTFPLQGGTRQGCSLFATVVEPLTETINASSNICGFKFGLHEEKVVLHADDLLLFLGDTGGSLTNAMSPISYFGKILGSTITWDWLYFP